MTRTRTTRTGTRATTPAGAQQSNGRETRTRRPLPQQNIAPFNPGDGSVTRRTANEAEADRADGNDSREIPKRAMFRCREDTLQDPWLAPDPLHDPTKSRERFPRAVHGHGPPKHQSAGGRAVENAAQSRSHALIGAMFRREAVARTRDSSRQRRGGPPGSRRSAAAADQGDAPQQLEAALAKGTTTGAVPTGCPVSGSALMETSPDPIPGGGSPGRTGSSGSPSGRPGSARCW